MSSAAPTRTPRMRAVLREGENVKPLELFFDLVFVLAITQCTALMADEPTWGGLAKGLLILGLLWWSWVGYAWLTSVVEPEEGAVRLVMFGAMAGLLVVALCIPRAFGDSAAGARLRLRDRPHRPDRALRRGQPRRRPTCATRSSGWPGAPRSASRSSWSAPRSATTPSQGALWALALLLDMGGPFLFGQEGWKLVPGHFAERHGLIIIIALGESIVAIGVGAETAAVDAGIVVAAVFGIAVAGAMWWLYFDVVALVAERRLCTRLPATSRTASRATPTPTCTSRWSPASCSPRWA